jgi:hypothetical protein
MIYVPDRIGFRHADVVFIVKIVLHVRACRVEKGADLEKGCGRWLVGNGAFSFQTWDQTGVLKILRIIIAPYHFILLTYF